MSNPRTAAIVLAAGKGTRFRSATAKVRHDAAGRSMIGHLLAALAPLGLDQVVVVVGHQAGAAPAESEPAGVPGATTVLQGEQRGTGHALEQALPALDADIEQVLVLPGDTPLLIPSTLERLVDDAGEAVAEGHAGAMFTAHLDDPTGYGRVLRDEPDGAVGAVVEERDATAEQRAVTEINAGMYTLDRGLLTGALDRLDEANAQGERYLTDIVGLLASDGRPLRPVVAPAAEVAGGNDRKQLTEAAGGVRGRHLDHLMVEVGVSVTDRAATWIDVDVEVGADTLVLPGCVLEAGTVVGERATIGPHTHLTACEVGDDAHVASSRGEGAAIGAGAEVGPFAHLRAGTRLGPETKAGAFVQTKNATVGAGSKVPHLAYLGDATVGGDVNVACGVVTVNYDGTAKHHTTIEDGAFVGCDTMLVAPITIGEGAYTAAGSTLTDDVPAGALGIARSRQTTKEGWADRGRGLGG